MKKFGALCLIIILLCVLVGCIYKLCADMLSPETVTAESELPQDEELFELLFNIENQITLQLDMNEEELAKMQADFEKYDHNTCKSPIYRKADLFVTILTPENKLYCYTIEEVGVRMKGNTSRSDFYSEEEGIYNLVHLKLSFQETFDNEAYYGDEAKVWTESERDSRKERTFATLEKMDLRWNRCDDGTYLKEYFAYETYREMGVPAPHINLASFDWAGIHMGVFTINEPIDEIFLSKNFPQEALGGDLYKVGWAKSNNGSFTSLNSIGIEDEGTGEFYAYDLTTNKKTSTHQALTTLINSLNSGDVTKESFASLVDIDTFLPYCAVSYLLGNPDDLRNNYNNCYLYFRADTGKVVIIPYDFDRCLGITAHWNPTGTGMTDDNPFSTKTLATNEDQKNPLILYSVAAGGYYVEEYAQILEEIISGDAFTFESFAALYETAAANYSDKTTPGKRFQNAQDLYLEFDITRTSEFYSNGNISIEEYLGAKIETLNFYLEQVDKYTDAEVQIHSVWYIRADFTNWQTDTCYYMTEEDGIFSIKLNRGSECRLKVYNSNTDRWYGAECVGDDCPVSFTTDEYTNIILQPGTYWIRIDPEKEEITLEME